VSFIIYHLSLSYAADSQWLLETLNCLCGLWISVPQYIYFFFLNLSAWGTGALRFKDHKGNWVFQGATGYQQHRIHVLGHWDSKTTKAIQRYLFSWISVPKYRYFTLQSHSVESQCPSTFTLQSHCTTNASTCLVRCRSWDSTVV